MAYDRVDWHSVDDFPADLPLENAGTHIGMFLAWAIQRGLEGELHRKSAGDDLARVRARRLTGRKFLIEHCDGKLWEDDLSDEGNAFARDYYEADLYDEDYEATFVKGRTPTIYHVKDTWRSFDRIAKVLDARFAEWKRGDLRKAGAAGVTEEPDASEERGETFAPGAIDPATGDITLEEPPGIIIGPSLGRAAFLASPLAARVEELEANEPFRSWKITGAALPGMRPIVVVLSYQGDRLAGIDVYHADPSMEMTPDDGSMEDDEERRRGAGGRVFGEARDLPWGSVQSSYDARSRSAGIHFRYDS